MDYFGIDYYSHVLQKLSQMQDHNATLQRSYDELKETCVTWEQKCVQLTGELVQHQQQNIPKELNAERQQVSRTPLQSPLTPLHHIIKRRSLEVAVFFLQFEAYRIEEKADLEARMKFLLSETSTLAMAQALSPSPSLTLTHTHTLTLT